MTDAPDLELLASRYLDLWQDQVAAVVNDPNAAEAMAKAYSLMVQGAVAFADAGGMPASNEATESHGPKAQSPFPDGSVAPGPEAAAVSPDGAGLDPAGLARRVAELEERVLRLEAALAAGGGRAQAGDRRRRR